MLSNAAKSDLWHFASSEVTFFFRRAPRISVQPFFDVLALPAANPHSRLLVVTPRKLASAPIRNKIRRRLREQFRQQYNQYAPAVDLLFIAKPASLSLPFHKLGTYVQKVLQKATQRVQEGTLKPLGNTNRPTKDRSQAG